MAKDKDKQVNPATAALKKQKAAALKKGKAQVAAQRTERFASRNPTRLQKQIDELKEIESRDGILRPRDKQTLEALEKDLRLIHKARESLGDKAPGFHSNRTDRQPGGDRRDRRDDRGGVLGKRRRDGSDWKHRPDADASSDNDNGNASSDTDADARDIPMPTDLENEPPIPRRRRDDARSGPHRLSNSDRNANNTPLGAPRFTTHELPPKPDFSNPTTTSTSTSTTTGTRPAAKAQTVYESAPQIRDLRKEAVSRFVPAAVAAKKKLARAGAGRLLEPEEMDRLERSGYFGTGPRKRDGDGHEDGDGGGGGEGDETLKDEEERFRREMEGLGAADDDDGGGSRAGTAVTGWVGSRNVQMEEVDDEG